MENNFELPSMKAFQIVTSILIVLLITILFCNLIFWKVNYDRNNFIKYKNTYSKLCKEAELTFYNDTESYESVLFDKSLCYKSINGIITKYRLNKIGDKYVLEEYK